MIDILKAIRKSMHFLLSLLSSISLRNKLSKSVLNPLKFNSTKSRNRLYKVNFKTEKTKPCLSSLKPLKFNQIIKRSSNKGKFLTIPHNPYISFDASRDAMNKSLALPKSSCVEYNEEFLFMPKK